MTKTFKGKGYQIQAKGPVGEIFLYDEIGESLFDEGITAKSFRDDLARLGVVGELRIFINSPGGSVFDGVAIFNQIARHKARKVVHIDGIAASIASVIAMAGDEILIAENGMMMIHSASGVTMGTAEDHLEMARSLERVDESIINTYVNRTGGDVDRIREMMAATTWMTAAEAVDLGFADKVSDPVDIAACVRGFDLEQKKAPDELVEASNVVPLADWKTIRAGNRAAPERPQTVTPQDGSPPVEPGPPEPQENRRLAQRYLEHLDARLEGREPDRGGSPATAAAG